MPEKDGVGGGEEWGTNGRVWGRKKAVCVCVCVKWKRKKGKKSDIADQEGESEIFCKMCGWIKWVGGAHVAP